MQQFTIIDPALDLDVSLDPIMQNFETIMSQNSGTSFPTTNLYIGMPCYRSDQGKLYVLASTGPDEWELIADLNKTLLSKEDADSLYFPQVPTADLSFNDHKLTSLADPTNAQDAATKNYIDSQITLREDKQHCRVLMSGNVNIANPGGSTFDGVTIATGNRVLLVGQTAGAQNGIYVFNGPAVAMTRAPDADTAAKLPVGTAIWITEGTSFAKSGWKLTTTAAITLGTTSLTFEQYTGASLIGAGTGLTKSGNTLSLAAVNPTGTGPKPTVDTYGRVTALDILLVADIPDLPFSKITSGVPNYALNGANITSFVNNAGFVTQGNINGTLAAGYTSFGSYTTHSFNGLALGGNTTISGLPGTWQAYGSFGADGYGNATYLLQRVA